MVYIVCFILPKVWEGGMVSLILNVFAYGVNSQIGKARKWEGGR